jgi:hypothetical protein
MERFQVAFASVMKNPSAALRRTPTFNLSSNLDGLHIPSGL